MSTALLWYLGPAYVEILDMDGEVSLVFWHIWVAKLVLCYGTRGEGRQPAAAQMVKEAERSMRNQDGKLEMAIVGRKWDDCGKVVW